MSIQPVKTAVVGCGHITDAYLNTMINKFQILDVVGCYNRTTEKAQRAAEKFGIRVLTMEEILEDDSIEIVVNLTNPTVHYEISKKLLEAGKHVYTEKVLAAKLEHAAELLQIADQNNLYLGAAPDTFLGAGVQTARYVVDSGMLGEITSCYAVLTRDSDILNRAFPFTAEEGGGIGFDVGIYFITALLSILGSVKEVSGVVKTLNPEKPHYSLEKFNETFHVVGENLMSGILHFERGTIGNILFDSNSVFVLPEQPALVLNGTQGIMYMADPNQFGGDVRVLLKGNSEPFTMQQSHAFHDEYRGLGVAEMAWSLRMGRKNRASKEMAYHALDVLYGIVRSSETKTNQAIESTFEQTPPLPRGYDGQGVFGFIEERSIAL